MNEKWHNLLVRQAKDAIDRVAGDGIEVTPDVIQKSLKEIRDYVDAILKAPPAEDVKYVSPWDRIENLLKENAELKREIQNLRWDKEDMV